MQVVVKKRVLEQMLHQLVEERSFHSRRYDQIAGDDKPVLPDAQVASQLSASTVPLGDPDFLPVNKQQLSSAASQMAQQVSPDKIQKFYSGLKKLIRKTGEKKQYKGMSDTDLMEEVRRAVRSILAESEDEEEDPFAAGADSEISNVTGGKAKSPVKRNVGRTSVGPKGDDFNPPSRDAVQDLLRAAGEGGETSVSAANTRQAMGIRAGQGYAFEKTPPVSDDSPATSVFDVNRRPKLRPLTIEDHLIGVVNNVLDSIKKKSLEKDASAPVVYPRNVAAGAIEIDIKEGEYKKERRIDKERADKLTDITITISSKKPDLMKPAVISIVGDKEAGTPFATSTGEPYTWDQYKKAFSKLYAEQAFIRNNYPSSKKDDPEVDITTDDEADGFKELSQDQIYYQKIEDLSVELGVPAGSLRNLAADFGFVAGEPTESGASPSELSPYRVLLYVFLYQFIYKDFIVEGITEVVSGVSLTGRDVANKKFDASDPSRKSAFKALFKSIESGELTFGDFALPDEFIDLLELVPSIKEDVTDVINGCIKYYLASGQFGRDFPEFKAFREGEDTFKGLKNVSKTVERLAIRDVNSLIRFVAGFDFVKRDLVARCLLYLYTMARNEVPDQKLVDSLELVKDDLDELLFKRPDGKWKLAQNLEDTKDAVEALSDISSYTEPEPEILIQSIKKSLKSVGTESALGKKRKKLIEKIANAVIAASV